MDCLVVRTMVLESCQPLSPDPTTYCSRQAFCPGQWAVRNTHPLERIAYVEVGIAVVR